MDKQCDDLVEVIITFPDPDRLSLRKRIHRLWCKQFWDSPYPGLERALEDLLERAVGDGPVWFRELQWCNPIVIKEA